MRRIIPFALFVAVVLCPRISLGDLNPTSGVICNVKAEVLETKVTHSEYTKLALEQRVGGSSRGWTKMKILETDCAEDQGQERVGEEFFVKIRERFPQGTVVRGNLSHTHDEWIYRNFFEDIELLYSGEDDERSVSYFVTIVFILVTVIGLFAFLIRKKYRVGK